jgi:hypothetical protein
MGSNAREILNRIKISDVYRALTSTEPRRTSTDTLRGRAVWRDGNGLSVSLNDRRGFWHDFVTHDGGGVLDLIVRVRGDSHQDALRWLADLVGLPLDDRPLSPEERRRWAQQKRLFEQELPRARYWRRAAIVLCECLLDTLKDQFFTRSSQIQTTDLCDITEMRSRLQHLDGAELVAEYRWWFQHQAALVIGMVGAAENLEGAERRAVQNYIRMTEAET